MVSWPCGDSADTNSHVSSHQLYDDICTAVYSIVRIVFPQFYCSVFTYLVADMRLCRQADVDPPPGAELLCSL